jgi:hypothetical protein
MLYNELFHEEYMMTFTIVWKELELPVFLMKPTSMKGRQWPMWSSISWCEVS